MRHSLCQTCRSRYHKDFLSFVGTGLAASEQQKERIFMPLNVLPRCQPQTIECGAARGKDNWERAAFIQLTVCFILHYKNSKWAVACWHSDWWQTLIRQPCLFPRLTLASLQFCDCNEKSNKCSDWKLAHPRHPSFSFWFATPSCKQERAPRAPKPSGSCSTRIQPFRKANCTERYW